MATWWCSAEATNDYDSTGIGGDGKGGDSAFPLQRVLAGQTPEVDPGDIVALLPGRYRLQPYTRVRIQGAPGRPIRFLGCPGVTLDWSLEPQGSWESVDVTVAPVEAQSLPAGSVTLTTVLPDFPRVNGSEVAPYGVGGFVDVAGRLLRLIDYRDPRDFFAQNERHLAGEPGSYVGPGVFVDGSQVYVRLDSVDQALVTLSGTRSGTGTSTGPWSAAEARSARVDLAWTHYQGTTFLPAFVTESSSSSDSDGHLSFENLEFYNPCGYVLRGSWRELSLNNVRVNSAAGGILIESGSSDVSFSGCVFDGHQPDYVAWTDAKPEGERVIAGNIATRGATVVGEVTGVSVRDCTFRNLFDGLAVLDAIPSDANLPVQLIDRVRIIGCTFEGIMDDSLQLGTGVTDVEVGDCDFLRCTHGPSRQNANLPVMNRRPGTVFIHHCVVDLAETLKSRARVGEEASLAMGSGFALNHSAWRWADEADNPAGRGPLVGDIPPWKIYQNTLLARGRRKSPLRGGSEQPVLSPYRALAANPRPVEPGELPTRTQEVFHNVFVQHSDVPIHDPDTTLRGGHYVFDGNLYYSTDGEPFYLGSGTDQAATLDEFRQVLADRTTEFYPPGWEAVGRWGNPLLGGDYRPDRSGPAATAALDLARARPTWPGVDRSGYVGARPPAIPRSWVG